jgi:hypothetical protein
MAEKRTCIPSTCQTAEEDCMGISDVEVVQQNERLSVSQYHVHHGRYHQE